MLSSQVKSRYKQLAKYIKTHEVSIEKLRQDIHNREVKQFENFQALPVGDININDINTEEIHDLLRNKYENPNVLTAIGSLVRSVIYTTGSATSHVERIRHWIRKMTLLSSGSYGQTFMAALDDGESDFIVKVPESSDDSESLFHEMMVGLLCANELRKGNSEYLPVLNYSYVYGGFKCSHPILGTNEKPVTFCNFENNIQYVLYENISPAVNAGDYFDKGPSDVFLNSLLQLSFALKIGMERFDFSHGDLHPQNVRLRKLPGKMSIPYSINGHIVYVNTEFLAVMIDYGMGHFLLEDGPYGFSGSYSWDVFPDLSFPLRDIFQYITWTAKWCGKKNRKLFKFLERLFVYFSEEDLQSFIDKTKEYGPFLPRFPFAEQTVDSFLDFLRINFGAEVDEILSTEAKYEVFGCEMCDSESLILDEISGSGFPTDPFEFYDLIREKEENEVEQETINGLLKKYDYKEGFAILSRRIDDIHKSMAYLVSRTPLIQVRDVDTKNEKEVDAYFQRTDNVGKIYDLIQSYHTIEKVYNFLADSVFQIYNIRVNKINAEWLGQISKKINTYLKQIDEDIKYLARKKAISPISTKIYDHIRWYKELKV